MDISYLMQRNVGPIYHRTDDADKARAAIKAISTKSHHFNDKDYFGRSACSAKAP